MTDGEQTVVAVLSGGGGLAAVGRFVRWMFLTWMEDRKTERGERKAERDASIKATIDVAVAMNTMAHKFDGFSKELSGVVVSVRAVETAVEEVADEVTGRHEIPVENKQRAQTQPMGIAGYRGPKRPRQDT